MLIQCFISIIKTFLLYIASLSISASHIAIMCCVVQCEAPLPQALIIAWNRREPRMSQFMGIIRVARRRPPLGRHYFEPTFFLSMYEGMSLAPFMTSEGKASTTRPPASYGIDHELCIYICYYVCDDNSIIIKWRYWWTNSRFVVQFLILYCIW